MERISALRVSLESTISELIQCIQQSGALACALLYDQAGKFLGVVTDGDVRRSLMAGSQLSDTVHHVYRVKAASQRPDAIVANQHSSYEERCRLFREHSLRQLVIVDDQSQPIEVITYADVQHCPQFEGLPFTAVMMAGGFGTRMRPLTDKTPKPMLTVNGVPILEISMRKLISHGATKFYITTHYLPEVILDHFGHGERLGVEIEYIHEPEPLGTGGALSRITNPDDYTMVFNGDILTNMDVGMFFAHHLRHGAPLTVAATQYSYEVPFGVISEKAGWITRIDEKPSYSFLVNSGMYFLSREAFSMLPKTEKYNMTDVMANLLNHSKSVSCFPIFESWLDVGRPSDYELATSLFK